MTTRPPNIVRKSALVPYSAERMFTLVDRVEDYPKFLPWCGGTEVKRNDDGTVTATIRIDYHGVRQSFTTHNKRVPPESITITLQEGPFSHLEGQWKFTALREDACKVELFLEYRFAGLIGRVLEPVFDRIAKSFVEAFVRRAEHLAAMEA
ncbi:MAG: type II toxin-antitoxin system RatA family toxin [Limnobacter sp.]|nr:type II toxin-antitoxin system RatA family toxin [Limnobacter sp.]